MCHIFLSYDLWLDAYLTLCLFQGLYKELVEFEVQDIERLPKGQTMLNDTLVSMSFQHCSDNSLQDPERFVMLSADTVKCDCGFLIQFYTLCFIDAR